MKSRAIYNWSLKGTPAWWAIDHDPWTMSFIVSFSYKRVEGILVSNISIKSFSYKNFVSVIWKRQIETDEDKSDRVCIVFDNASFHVNKAAICCYRELGARWILISPIFSSIKPNWKTNCKNKSRYLKSMDKIQGSEFKYDQENRRFNYSKRLLKYYKLK